MLDPSLEQTICTALQVTSITRVDMIQGLWGGYGQLLRVYVDNAADQSFIVKRIRLPQPSSHPHDWNTLRSHQRKLKSYRVESVWYQNFSNTCHGDNPVPLCLHVDQSDDEIILILQDLSERGFPVTLTACEQQGIQACLKWLGAFHGQFIHHSGKGLWDIGTYWHLATRPDELEALQDLPLKRHAIELDRLLSETPYQTLVHGDAKLANFCFSEGLTRVAAVDFQYVGKGCGMKDVVLFLSSVLKFDESDEQIEAYLDTYFNALQQSLTRHHSHIDAHAVEKSWRPLYSVAWADFQRFIKGWKPTHWKINPYTESLTKRAIDSIAAPQNQRSSK